MPIAAIGLCVCAAALAAPAAAVAPSGDIVARDQGAYMERLADGVYAIVHAHATTDWETGTLEWPHGNTGVIVGDEAVLVVDTTYLPSRAQADIAMIRSVTDRPVRYVVNTHWHGDHTHGNGVYLKQFPGLQIVGQQANRDWIALNLARYPALVASGASGKDASLEALTTFLADGRDASGALTPGRRRALADNIARRRHELEQFRTIQIAPPTVLFDDQMVIYLGERRVELRNQGRANSPADVTVYLPREQIVFTGDIVVHPVPFVGASHPLPWIDVLRRIETMPAVAIVPGHGPVLRDLRYVRLVRELLEAARDRTAALMRQGRLPADTVGQVDLSDFLPRFEDPADPTIRHQFDQAFEDVLVERMHQCLQGYRC